MKILSGIFHKREHHKSYDKSLKNIALIWLIDEAIKIGMYSS